ncbi:chalcone-flavanone isomerase [Sporodiniella umbellata]|nr:chalcone-flavanone isomerase [Sporodiniella umbellata]
MLRLSRPVSQLAKQTTFKSLPPFQKPVSAEAPVYAGTVEDPATKLSFPIFLNTSNEWKKLIGLGEFDKEKFVENEEMANELLDQPFDVSIRLIPFRNTNTQHLRDGFVRAFLQRMKAQSLTEEQEREILLAIQEFKSNFATMNVKKETEFVFTKTKEGGLRMVYEGKDWGTVSNHWLAKNFILSYLTPHSPSSEAAHEDIVLGFERLMKIEK